MMVDARFPVFRGGVYLWSYSHFTRKGRCYQESVDQLNAATPDQFTPSLTILDALIQSLAFAPQG